MAFSDLQIKVASETAVMGLQKNLAWTKYFAHDFSPMASQRWAGVQVPVFPNLEANEFAEGTHDWCTGTNPEGTVVQLSKHWIQSYSIPDTGIGVNVEGGAYNGTAYGETNVNILRDGAVALTNSLTNAANQYFYNTVLDTVTKTEEFEIGTDKKESFANLFALCQDYKASPFKSVLVLNPTVYAKMLSTLDSCAYGNSSPIQEGIAEKLYGFQAVLCSSYLKSGTLGAIIPYGTVGIVNRYNAPAVNGYVNAWRATNEDGLTIGFRVFEHLCHGALKFGADMLFGASILQDGIIKLVEGSESETEEDPPVGP